MLAQRDVRGRKPDGAAALVALLDHALDLPGVASSSDARSANRRAALANAGRGIISPSCITVEHGDSQGPSAASSRRRSTLPLRRAPKVKS